MKTMDKRDPSANRPNDELIIIVDDVPNDVAINSEDFAEIEIDEEDLEEADEE